MTTAPKDLQSLSDTEIAGYLLFLRSHPQSRVFAPLAEFLIQSNRLTEAEYICRNGLAANPDFAPGHLAYARVLFKLLRYNEALEELKQTLRLNRSNVDAYLIAAEIYLIHNRHHAAQQACVRALEIDPRTIEAEQLLSRINQSTPARDPPPATDEAAKRTMAITDTRPHQRLRPQQVVPAEKPLRKVIAEVGQVAEDLLDHVQQPFSAESSGSQPRSEAPAPVSMTQSNLAAVDLAQAVIDSYADRVLPLVTDLSPPRLPRTDRWINMLWLIVIIGVLGFLIVLMFHAGGDRIHPIVPDTAASAKNPIGLESRAP
jgi:hypothetical protein